MAAKYYGIIPRPDKETPQDTVVVINTPAGSKDGVPYPAVCRSVDPINGIYRVDPEVHGAKAVAIFDAKMNREPNSICGPFNSAQEAQIEVEKRRLPTEREKIARYDQLVRENEELKKAGKPAKSKESI